MNYSLFQGQEKKTARNICKKNLNIKIERDWLLGLGAILSNGNTGN